MEPHQRYRRRLGCRIEGPVAHCHHEVLQPVVEPVEGVDPRVDHLSPAETQREPDLAADGGGGDGRRHRRVPSHDTGARRWVST